MWMSEREHECVRVGVCLCSCVCVCVCVHVYIFREPWVSLSHVHSGAHAGVMSSQRHYCGHKMDSLLVDFSTKISRLTTRIFSTHTTEGFN